VNQKPAHRTIAKHLAALAVGLSAVVAPTAAIAQEYDGCFWIDERGKRIDLSDFCPQPQATPGTDSNSNIGSPANPTDLPSIPSDPNTAIVPIVRRDAGIPVLSVLFNGRPYEMLLDTGASVVVLPARVARELGIEATGSMLVSTASASRVEFGVSQVQSAQLGSLVVNDLDVAIAGNDAIEIGLLGQNFYSDYDLTVRQDTIELTRRTGM